MLTIQQQHFLRINLLKHLWYLIKLQNNSNILTVVITAMENSKLHTEKYNLSQRRVQIRIVQIQHGLLRVNIMENKHITLLADI